MATALARSYLYAPGDRPSLLDKVMTAGADAVILDLEDSVPAAGKEAAREAVATAVGARRGRPSPAVWVRINGETGDWKADLERIVVEGLRGVRLPKVESAAWLSEVAGELDRLESARGLAPESLRLTATVESAAGGLAASELARASRVDHLAFGSSDYLADVGANPESEDTATLWVRSHLVVVSRAYGIGPPIAPVHTRLEDDDGLARACESSRSLGFFGASCIHPRQIPVVHRVFSPRPEEVERARRMIAELERAAGGTAITETGQFLDEAVVRRARALVELADGLEAEASRQEPIEEGSNG